MRCPRCARELAECTRMGVVVDVCDRCRGVWLDGGEMDKLLAALREGERQQTLLRMERRAGLGNGSTPARRKREVWGRMLHLFE